MNAQERYALWMNSPDIDEQTKAELFAIKDDPQEIEERFYTGTMSAYCGCLCAASGAGAGIAFLEGMSAEQICRVVVNGLGMLPGMICDGAKPACAGKAAMGIHMSSPS